MADGHDHDIHRLQAGVATGLIQMIYGAGGDEQYPSNHGYPGLRFANDASPGPSASACGRATSPSRSSTSAAGCSTPGHATADVKR